MIMYISFAEEKGRDYIMKNKFELLEKPASDLRNVKATHPVQVMVCTRQADNKEWNNNIKSYQNCSGK